MTSLDGYRYVVNISFKNDGPMFSKSTQNVVEPVKTLKEAQSYKILLDDTVKKAIVIDRVTGKVIETWVP